MATRRKVDFGINSKKKNFQFKIKLILFMVVAIIIITILDLWIVKTYGLIEYIALNFFEWLMFAMGYFTHKALSGD